MTEDEAHNLFRYDHLPPHLQEVSKPFHDLAQDLARQIEDGSAETKEMLDSAIRLLWDVKNRVVWAAVEEKKLAELV